MLVSQVRTNRSILALSVENELQRLPAPPHPILSPSCLLSLIPRASALTPGGRGKWGRVSLLNLALSNHHTRTRHGECQMRDNGSTRRGNYMGKVHDPNGLFDQHRFGNSGRLRRSHCRYNSVPLCCCNAGLILSPLGRMCGDLKYLC